ncbi:MAG: DUF4214 domain-containing protein [Acidimicrobiales bacterium]|nr:DUF4214 domain-containing protein [Acidimicrobiales bacterium]
MPIRRIVAAIAAALVAVALLPTAPSGAAGMTTHTWMADSAIDRVETPALRALLLDNLDYLKAGAKFPDGGYVPGNIHGEEAHWQRFADVYLDLIRNKDECGQLSRPDGPCAAQIAHLFGIVAHGTGDEVWDWLFEPNSPDRDEYYTADLPTASEGGAETQMDLVAIGLYGRPADPVPTLTFTDDLIAAFDASGVPGVTAQQINVAQAVFTLLHQVESGWADTHLDGILEAMPWMSEHLVDAPGGVDWAARSIAAQWESLWAQLLGAPIPTRVSNTYPDSLERGVPATGWTRRPYPGSSRDRGGARTRIAASLTYSTPYRVPGGGGVSQTLPAGAMTLTEAATGTVVPSMSGFPQNVPYTADPGEHTIAIQPAGDLQPCTWYRVSVTDLLLDGRGSSVVPHSWTFRTGLGSDGAACPDDPTGDTAVADYVARAYRDLLGREATAADVAFWTAALEGGASPTWFAVVLMSVDEGRRAVVDDLYRRVLDRGATAGERALWADALAGGTTTAEIQARLLDSAEFTARAGGTPEGWLSMAYATILGRAIDPPSLTLWSAYLGSGGDRLTIARALTGGGEARRVTAHRTLAALDDTSPSTDAVTAEAALPGDLRHTLIRVATRPPYLPEVLVTP